ncbi:MerR family transcriptional regulator [Microbispora amethystogenes]|uniref:MerR family transcriptional regulator n=1 Tax=Microbispora amethystogenes TaxID=1427754 RepID=UPI0033FB68C7
MAAEPLTASQVANRLRVPVSRVYVWAHRYQARKARRGRTVYYDWHDLKTIERCIRLGQPVPETPQERDQLRAHAAA